MYRTDREFWSRYMCVCVCVCVYPYTSPPAHVSIHSEQTTIILNLCVCKYIFVVLNSVMFNPSVKRENSAPDTLT